MLTITQEYINHRRVAPHKTNTSGRSEVKQLPPREGNEDRVTNNEGGSSGDQN